MNQERDERVKGVRDKPAGVIFDLDGTLADTLHDITDSINALFAQIGCPPVAPGRIRGLVGVSLRNLVQQASGSEDPERITALVEGYRRVYRERMLERTRLYPGIPAILDTLVQRGVSLAVLSNKPHEFTAPICEALLAAWPFVRLLGARDDTPRKPDPTVALKLAKEMNIPPSRVYFVGDSPVDVQTAHNAGMTSVAVAWGYGDREVLEGAEPMRFASQPLELLDLLP